MTPEGIQEIPEKLIDIRMVIASKNPVLARLIPGFVVSWLKRLLHVDMVNGYVYRHRDLKGLPFVEAILREFGVKVKVNDRRTGVNRPDALIPREGRFLIVANHPLGGIDGMALMQELGRFRPDIVFPVNDFLLFLPGLKPLFIPINKHGRNTENAEIINETFASDKTILYFPAGLVSRKFRMDGQTVIHDLEWKTTFIKKAKRYHRDIIPVHVDGRNSEKFYNLAIRRKRLGIKANIEMLYLVDEMVKQLGQTITLTVGDPIPWETFDRSKKDTEWAAWMRDHVYQLGRP
ncbi:MAG TPA: 1-acyl-sn-glycerol-3-phosphate acyltransferase [Bacteroidales bacterium]|nr:1-acyl-sn-glycerol-3-phosphate acyltransferase [Bacteroidales bacterium]